MAATAPLPLPETDKTVSSGQFKEEHFPEVLAFLRRHYPDPWLQTPAGESYYRWKYLDRPRDMHNSPSGRWLTISGRMAGFLGQLPFWLDGSGPSREAAWLSDWNIDESVRGRGLGVSQLQAALADVKATACLVASEA